MNPSEDVHNKLILVNMEYQRVAVERALILGRMKRSESLPTDPARYQELKAISANLLGYIEYYTRQLAQN